MRGAITVLAALALLAAAPAIAMAQGNSGIDEYVEELPNPGGGDDTNAAGNDAADDSGGALTPEQVGALEQQGADAAGDPADEAGGAAGDDSGEGASSDSGTATAGEDDSGVTEVVGDLASGSDDGMGIVLPIVMVAAALAAVGFVLVRRNRDGADSA